MNRALPTFDFGLHRTLGKGIAFSERGTHMENKIPKGSPARDFRKSLSDEKMAELLTLISFVSKDLAKEILIKKLGRCGGTYNGDRHPF